MKEKINYNLIDIKKTIKETNFTTVYLVEPLAIRLVFLFSNYTKITPNQITLLSLFIGIIGFLVGLYGFYLISALFFYFAFVFDNIDGKIARLKGLSSKKGYMLDSFVDINNIFLYSILLLYIYYLNNLNIFYFFLFFILHFYRLYYYIIIEYFKGQNIKNKIFILKNNSLKTKIIPVDIDVLYFFHFIGILILIQFGELLLVKINIILTTLYYILLFFYSFIIRFNKLDNK